MLIAAPSANGLGDDLVVRSASAEASRTAAGDSAFAKVTPNFLGGLAVSGSRFRAPVSD